MNIIEPRKYKVMEGYMSKFETETELEMEYERVAYYVATHYETRQLSYGTKCAVPFPVLVCAKCNTHTPHTFHRNNPAKKDAGYFRPRYRCDVCGTARSYGYVRGGNENG